MAKTFSFSNTFLEALNTATNIKFTSLQFGSNDFPLDSWVSEYNNDILSSRVDLSYIIESESRVCFKILDPELNKYKTIYFFANEDILIGAIKVDDFGLKQYNNPNLVRLDFETKGLPRKFNFVSNLGFHVIKTHAHPTKEEDNSNNLDDPATWTDIKQRIVVKVSDYAISGNAFDNSGNFGITQDVFTGYRNGTTQEKYIYTKNNQEVYHMRSRGLALLGTPIEESEIDLEGRSILLATYRDDIDQRELQASDFEDFSGTLIENSIIYSDTEPVVHVEELRINNPDPFRLLVGKKVRLDVTILPENSYERNLFYNSSDPSKATITNLGMITTLAVGSTILKVSSPDNIENSITLTVINPVTGVTVFPTNSILNLGDELDIRANIIPPNATIQIINWTISNSYLEKIEELPGNILRVKGVGKGTTLVTARTDDGGFEAISTIIIQVKVTSFTIEQSREMIFIGTPFQLTYEILPTDADNKNINWTSSNPEVATVDNMGLVTPLTIGNTIITGVSVDGEFTDSCEFIVYDPATYKPVVSLGFVETSPISLESGSSTTIHATYNPSDATNKVLNWRVTQGFTITPTIEGEATLTHTDPSKLGATVTIDSDEDNTITKSIAVVITT